MRKSRKPEPEVEDVIDAALESLLELANKYPFRWWGQGRVGLMCGFSKHQMTELANVGAPIVSKRANPHLLHRWLCDNHATVKEKMAKIGAPKEGK